MKANKLSHTYFLSPFLILMKRCDTNLKTPTDCQKDMANVERVFDRICMSPLDFFLTRPTKEAHRYGNVFRPYTKES
jgi:hypothetical protein